MVVYMLVVFHIGQIKTRQILTVRMYRIVSMNEHLDIVRKFPESSVPTTGDISVTDWRAVVRSCGLTGIKCCTYGSALCAMTVE